MLIYNYDPVTGEFISTSEAILDVRATELSGKDVYLIPSNSTDIIPAKVIKGYVNCFDATSNSWKQQEDHRGQVVFYKKDLSTYTITDIGPIPSQFLTTIPEAENEYQIWQDGEFVYPEIEELRKTLKTKVDEAYNKKLSVPYRCGQYYVLPEWASTYTTTLVAMQQDVAADGKLDEEYQILLITDINTGALKQVKMTNIEQFMPYYNRVKDSFKDIITEYHNIIAQLSTITEVQKLIDLVLNY